jgi:transcriptional regulator with XRE-family HTH domain
MLKTPSLIPSHVTKKETYFVGLHTPQHSPVFIGVKGRIVDVRGLSNDPRFVFLDANLRTPASPRAFQTARDDVRFVVCCRQEAANLHQIKMPSNVKNCLRRYRKRSGLGQRDVAFLLGSNDAAQVCRYEKGHCIPTLRTAFLLAATFDLSLETLFSGNRIGIESSLVSRMHKLCVQLDTGLKKHRPTAADSQKLRWLNERTLRLSKNSHSQP